MRESGERGVIRLSVVSEAVPDRQFCSVNARTLGADPLGTAPMYDEFIMMEFDLPWARNVVDSAEFPGGVAAAVAEAKDRGRRVQLQCFAPDGRYSRPGMCRVMYFSRRSSAPEASSQYASLEYVVPVDGVEALIRFLLLGDGGGDSDGAGFASFRVERGNVRDLFVCTHGARDACCGKYGVALQIDLDAVANATVARRETAGAADNVDIAAGDDDTAETNQRVCQATGHVPAGRTRVWRVNHLGGHRFAPTLLELPAARYWGALESDVVQTLVDGPAGLDRLRPYYRGWSGLHSPAEQVAEAEAWRRIGSAWLAYDKTIYTVVRRDDGPDAGSTPAALGDGTDRERAQVVLEWTDPRSGKRGRIEVGVEVSHMLTLLESCGAEEVHSEQYVVARYEEFGRERAG